MIGYGDPAQNGRTARYPHVVTNDDWFGYHWGVDHFDTKRDVVILVANAAQFGYLSIVPDHYTFCNTYLHVMHDLDVVADAEPGTCPYVKDYPHAEIHIIAYVPLRRRSMAQPDMLINVEVCADRTAARLNPPLEYITAQAQVNPVQFSVHAAKPQHVGRPAP